MATKAQRPKLLDDEHVKAFHESEEGAEFRDFCKTGIAARISNLSSVYTMYLNTLDRQTDKKKKLSDIIAKHGIAERKDAGLQEQENSDPKKKEQPTKIKQSKAPAKTALT